MGYLIHCTRYFYASTTNQRPSGFMHVDDEYIEFDTIEEAEKAIRYLNTCTYHATYGEYARPQYEARDTPPETTQTVQHKTLPPSLRLFPFGWDE